MQKRQYNFMTQYFVELKYFGLHSGYICLLEGDKFRLIREISMLQQ